MYPNISVQNISNNTGVMYFGPVPKKCILVESSRRETRTVIKITP